MLKDHLIMTEATLARMEIWSVPGKASHLSVSQRFTGISMVSILVDYCCHWKVPALLRVLEGMSHVKVNFILSCLGCALLYDEAFNAG